MSHKTMSKGDDQIKTCIIYIRNTTKTQNKENKQKEWLVEHTNCAVEISVMLTLKGNQTEDPG